MEKDVCPNCGAVVESQLLHNFECSQSAEMNLPTGGRKDTSRPTLTNKTDSQVKTLSARFDKPPIATPRYKKKNPATQQDGRSALEENEVCPYCKKHFTSMDFHIPLCVERKLSSPQSAPSKASGNYENVYMRSDVFTTSGKDKELQDEGFRETMTEKGKGHSEDEEKEHIFVELCKACSVGDREKVKHLIAQHPNVKTKVDAAGWTLMHWAALGGNVDIFKFLAEQGLDPSRQSLRGKNVLSYATEQGKEEMVCYLMKEYPTLQAAMEKTDPKLASRAEEIANVTKEQNAPSAWEVQSRSLSLSVIEEIKRAGDTIGLRRKGNTPLASSKLSSTSDYSSLHSSMFSAKTSVTSSGTWEEFLAHHGDEKESETDYWPTEINEEKGTFSLRAYIWRKGKSAEEVTIFLSWICSRIKSSFDDIAEVLPGFSPDKQFEPVFLAILKKGAKPLLSSRTFYSFLILFKEKDTVSTEGQEIMKLELSRKLAFSVDEYTRIHACLSKHSSNLIAKHSNLEVISASKLKSRGFGTTKATIEEITCIVLYVSTKGFVPFDEEIFPTELDGLSVDVREGLFEPYTGPSKYYDKLKMGCQIGSAYGTCGTLGGFVDLGMDGIGCLTCCHVFFSNETKPDSRNDGTFTLSNRNTRREVYQPGSAVDCYKFGHLVDAILTPGDDHFVGVDAALIQIDNFRRYPENGTFPNATLDLAGFSPEEPMQFDSGHIFKDFSEIPQPCTVVKYGYSTEHTVGLLRLAGTAVHKRKYIYEVQGGKFELNQQLEILPIEGTMFSCAGDSGSLVFAVTEKDRRKDVRALGMLVGGTTYSSCIITPIWAVLQQFDLPLRLKSFQEPIVNERRQQPVEGMESLHNRKSHVIYSRKDVIDERDQPLSNRMTKVETDISSLSTGVTDLKRDVEKRMTKMDDRMTKMDSNLAQLTTQMATGFNAILDKLQ